MVMSLCVAVVLWSSCVRLESLLRCYLIVTI